MRNIQSDSCECWYWVSFLSRRPRIAQMVVASSPTVAAMPKTCTRQSISGPDAM